MTNLSEIFKIPTALAQGASNFVQNNRTQTAEQETSFLNNIVSALPLWFLAVLIVILSFVVAFIARKAVESKLLKSNPNNEGVKNISGQIVFYSVLVLGITIALSIIGIDLKPIVAAAAFGLGFAMKDIASNFMAGVILLITKPFEVGDTVKVNGETGKVVEIQTRCTIIKNFDGFKIIIPNADMINNKVVSRTSFQYRRIVIEQGVGYGNDLDKVVKLTLAAVNAVPEVLKKPKATVNFTEWDDTWILFKIKAWIVTHGPGIVKVKNEIFKNVTKAYEEADIYNPYYIQGVQLESPVKGYSEAEFYDRIDEINKFTDKTTKSYKEELAQIQNLKEKYKLPKGNLTANATVLSNILSKVENIGNKFNPFNNQGNQPQSIDTSLGQNWLKEEFENQANNIDSSSSLSINTTTQKPLSDSQITEQPNMQQDQPTQNLNYLETQPLVPNNQNFIPTQGSFNNNLSDNQIFQNNTAPQNINKQELATSFNQSQDPSQQQSQLNQFQNNIAPQNINTQELATSFNQSQDPSQQQSQLNQFQNNTAPQNINKQELATLFNQSQDPSQQQSQLN